MYMAINDVIMYVMKLSAKWMMITEQAGNGKVRYRPNKKRGVA